MKDRLQYVRLFREPCCLPGWIWYSISFLIGAVFLISFSALQKALVGELQLLLKPSAYIVPFFYGGVTGVVIGRWYRSLRKKEADLLESYDVTISGWAKAIELRDQVTENHSQRVTLLTDRIARRMNLPAEQRVHIRHGALLHDIGKIGVSDSILKKPGSLTPEERKIVEEHPVRAYEMLRDIEFLQPALCIPLYHHERWDGSGYPEGLQGTDIPLEARIFAVVDVWDALTSDRPYRQAWAEDDALAYIEDAAGTLFDPDVVRVFGDFLRS